MAVLKDDKEMIIGDVPLTPGLPTPPLQSGGSAGSAASERHITSKEKEDIGSKTPTEGSVKEKREGA